jgi:hypothetical protein
VDSEKQGLERSLRSRLLKLTARDGSCIEVNGGAHEEDADGFKLLLRSNEPAIPFTFGQLSGLRQILEEAVAWWENEE